MWIVAVVAPALTYRRENRSRARSHSRFGTPLSAEVDPGDSLPCVCSGWEEAEESGGWNSHSS